MSNKVDFYNSRYFNLNKKMLRFMGLWPYQKRVFKLLIQFFFSVAMLIALIPQILCLRKFFRVNTDKVIQGIATILYLSAIFLKLLTAIITEKKLKVVYENMVTNWEMLDSQEEKDILTRYSENGRLLTVGYVLYMYSALALFITMPMIPIIIDVVFPVNDTRSRIFILDGEYVADKNEHYFQIYLFESYTCILTVVAFCTIDATYAVCVEQCVGLMTVVKFRLKIATKYAQQILYYENPDKDIPYQSMIKCIKLHKRVINFANILESSYSMSFLIVMSVNALILSVGSIVILINLTRPLELIRYGMIMIGLMIHMFYLSWPGQKLFDSSSCIHHESYSNEWYQCSLKTQRIIQFMMFRAMDPCQLTAGGIYVMNMSNFGMLVKSAMSYITVFASYR